MKSSLLAPYAILVAISIGAVPVPNGSIAAVKDLDWSSLSSEKKRAVLSGEPLLLSAQVEGLPWPEVIVWKWIPAAPEEVAGVFADFDRTHEFMPDLSLSKINSWLDARTVTVDYVLDLPLFLEDEAYTVKNVLSRAPDGEGFEIRWTLVKATSTKRSEGFARFEERDGGTLMTYYNLVEPGRNFAGWLKSQAYHNALLVTQRTEERVEQERRETPDLLKKQIEDLRRRFQ